MSDEPLKPEVQEPIGSTTLSVAATESAADEASLPPMDSGLGVTPQSRRLALEYHTGDLFDAPPHSVLIHSCNTQGKWGAGIARSFKEQYPEAFEAYRRHCRSAAGNPDTGTCLLLPPMVTDPQRQHNHWIACLFTSRGYGRRKDPPDVIMQNTAEAMAQLLSLIDDKAEVRTLRMCKINSGRFGVPWEKTVTALLSVEVPPGCPKKIQVWEL
jgi:ADP-ribose 1''-phosphate phosphatase